MSGLSIEEWKTLSPYFGDDIQAVFDFKKSVASRNVPGGTSPDALMEQLGAATTWLNSRR